MAGADPAPPVQPAGGEPTAGPTTGYWQSLEPASGVTGSLGPPWQWGVPVALPGGRVLRLPVRRLAGSADRAVASLIANQASFDVVDALADAMARLAAPLAPDLIVGLPTLGQVFAPPVARQLGHARWLPLGYSRKFWYDEALSVPVQSITTPGGGKRIYLDPNVAPLLPGRRVLIVDDAVSSGRTLAQVWPLLEGQGAEVVGAVVAMRQGTAWRQALGAARAGQVLGVFDSPLLIWRGGGWWPAAEPAR